MLARTRPHLRGIGSLCVLAVCLQAQSASADVLTVGPDPLTSDFTRIQTAVDAAASGDTILVAPGDYEGFRISTKALTVLGAGDGQTRITEIPVSPFVAGNGIRVGFVDSGVTRIGGFLIDATLEEPFFGAFPAWVFLERCNAPVELFDIEVRKPIPGFWRYFSGIENAPNSGYVNVVDCRRVLLSDVRVTDTAQQELPNPESGAASVDTVEGFAGLMLHDSFAWAANCRFEGCPLEHCFGDQPPLAPVRPGAGARLWNSRLVASNTYFEGGRGQSELGAGCIAIPGGAGLVLQFGSQARLLGGPDAGVQGGSSLGSALGGSGAFLYGPSSLIHAADTTPVGGFAGSGLAAPSIIETPPELVQVIVLDGERPALIPPASSAQQGASIQLDLVGGQLSSPLLDGDLFLDPAVAQMLGVFALDGFGSASTTLQVPVGPEFAGISIAMQTVELAQPLFVPAPPIFLASRP